MPQWLIEGLNKYTYIVGKASIDAKVTIRLHTRWRWQMAPNLNFFLSSIGCFKRNRTVLSMLWQFDHISFQFIQLYKGWVIICSCHSVEFPCLCAFLGKTFQCTHAPSVPFNSTILFIYCFLICNKLNTVLCPIMRLQKAAKLQNNTKIGEHFWHFNLMLKKSLFDDDKVIYIAKNKGLSIRVNITRSQMKSNINKEIQIN